MMRLIVLATITGIIFAIATPVKAATRLLIQSEPASSQRNNLQIADCVDIVDIGDDVGDPLEGDFDDDIEVGDDVKDGLEDDALDDVNGVIEETSDALDDVSDSVEESVDDVDDEIDSF